MSTMIRGVIFDLGNTLLRFAGNWSLVLGERSAALARSLRARGYAQDPRFDTAYAENLAAYSAGGQPDWVEYTAVHVLRQTLEALHLEMPDDETLAAAVRESLMPSEKLWVPFDDTHAVLRDLRAAGYRLAIVSNTADEEHAYRIADNAGLREYFDPIILSAAFGYRKPNPRLFLAVAQQWGLPPAEIAVVGDRLGADVLGAQFAGMRSVWATMDADAAANAAHREHIVPDATIGALSDLPGVLAQLGQQ